METSDFPKAEVMDLAEMVSYQPGAIVSRTILKKAVGNLSLFAFDKGESLSEHTAPFDAMIQVLHGTAEVIIAGTSYQVNEGQTIIMPANIPHAVVANSMFKMLLTMIKA